MHRDPTEFRARFKAYKEGKMPYDAGLPKYRDGKRPKGDGIRYLWDDQAKEWDRVTDDPMMRAFADLTVTPSGSRDDNRTNPVYHDPRLKYAGYVTKSMLEDEANSTKQRETGQYAPGLELVSPEFDLLMLGSALRSNPLTQRLWRNRTLSKEMDRVFSLGLNGATKDMPVVKASDMYNPEHFRSTVKYNPRLLENIKPYILESALSAERAVFKDPYGYPLEDWQLSEGLHEYPIEDSYSNAINLIKNQGSAVGDYNAAKLGVSQIEKAPRPKYTSFDLAPNTPEAEYTGKAATNTIPANQLGLHTGEILNPHVFTQLPKLLPLQKLGYTDETFVDRYGNVNMRNLAKAVQQVYKDFEDYSGLQDYKQIFNRDNSGNPTNLFEHIRDVVKSAQNIPVPKGYTRQDLVLAALFHDVGKILDSSIHHGKRSAKLMKRYAPNVPDYVRDAVRQHMSGKLDLANPLAKALHFADVARGLTYDEAAFNFPHLLYDRDVPKLNIQQIPLRDELKSRINPWLSAQGYPTISLNSTYELALQSLKDRILWHKTLERGVRDPIKLTNITPEDERNAENAIIGVMEKYGVDRLTAMSDEYLPQRLEYAATTIPKDATGSGRSNLFGVAYDFGNLPYHESTRYSRLIGADKQSQDGLYVSTSDQVKNNYATSSDNRGGEGYDVNFAESEYRPGESLSEYLLRNDWDLYNTEKLERGGPLGRFAMYEGPYRLLTGRSLMLDMKLAGIINPKFAETFLNISRPEDDWSTVSIDPRTGNTNKVPYISAEISLQKVNDALDDFGIKFKLNKTEDGAILFPKQLQELENKLSDLSTIKHNLTLDDGYNMNNYDERTRQFIIDLDFYSRNKLHLMFDEFNNLPKDELQSMIEYASALEDPNMIKQMFGDDVFSEKRTFKGEFPTMILNLLKSEGYITHKQIIAAKKAFLHGGDPLKYLHLDRIADKMLTEHLKSIKGKKLKQYKLDLNSIKVTPQQIISFMREKGVLPRYEIEGFNKQRLFAVKAPNKNKKKNSELSLEIYGYILGGKGEKVVEKRSASGYLYSKSHGRSGRDYGERTNNKMTRKTLRTLGPIAVGVSTLKPRRNSDDKSN